MLDDRTSERTDLDQSGLRLWDRASNRFAWAAYLGNADPNVAVPARRADLSGLPPTWIGVGTLDLFHDEDVEYARRLNAAGVECVLYVSPGMPHGMNIGSDAPIAEAFNRASLNALAAALW